ncbi:MAG TPA: lyase family protein [Actinomycetota bacterium]|nr:lyase family protein [Actinomycetota bacterium]
MIERYQTPEMTELWSQGATYERWREVELAVLAATDLPLEVSAAIYPSPDVDTVADRELEVRHDFVAWLQTWTGAMSPDLRDRIHYGLTSSDVVDTGLGLAIKRAGELIRAEAGHLTIALSTYARLHDSTFRVGRTHGRPAEVTTWGHTLRHVSEQALRAAGAHATSSRAASVAKMGGPVGTYAHLDRGTAAHVAAYLGLELDETPTQVANRDRIAAWAYDLCGLLAVCERVALEVRLGSLLGEITEHHSAGQVGSSAMPQKVNPVRSENLTGLARLGRGYLTPLMESVALWAERDISHSSVERVALVDLSTITHYALRQTADLLRCISIDREACLSHVRDAYPDLIRHWALLRMIDGGADRWGAHRALAKANTLEEITALLPGRAALPELAWFLRNAT